MYDNQTENTSQDLFPSRCIELIANYLSKDSKLTVLDLGPACNKTLNFLMPYNCKLSIADAYHHINDKDYVKTADNIIQLIPEHMQYDIIFCWDLLNYLEASEVTALLKHLSNISNNNALIYFFVLTKAAMPINPYHFAIVNEQQLCISSTAQEQTPCPRHSLRNIKLALQHFNSKRSFLLRNGLQENLWVRSEIEGSKLELMLS